MPLTNAQLQSRARAKRKEREERWEAALRRIASCDPITPGDVVWIAREALSDAPKDC